VTIQLMKQVKLTFDPNNILNPGKLFPADNA
jgi:D-lactate dehydrogenase